MMLRQPAVRIAVGLCLGSGLLACGPSVDMDAGQDPCLALQGIEVTRINNYEQESASPWAWSFGDGSEGAIDDVKNFSSVPPEAPQCNPVDGEQVTGSQALAIIMKGNNRWGSGAGGENVAEARAAGSRVRNGRGAGTDGLAFWAKAEGTTGLTISVSTWQTTQGLTKPQDFELNEETGIGIYEVTEKEPEDGEEAAEGPATYEVASEPTYRICAKWWRAGWDENGNDAPDLGERGDDITGDGIPEERHEIPGNRRCDDSFSARVNFPREWSLVKLPFTSFRQSADGRAWDELDTRSIGQVSLRFPGLTDMVLHIDWFGFYTESTPEEEPVSEE